MLPWDHDVDVQMSEESLTWLAKRYNSTIHKYPTGVSFTPGDEQYYLLDICPYHVDDAVLDRYNIIDARWIDMSNGLSIDITSLRHYSHKTTGEVFLGTKFLEFFAVSVPVSS